MSWLDIIIFILLIAIVFISFSVGLIRVASVFLGMYLGLQIAGVFYKLFGGLTSDPGSATSIQTNQIVWFGILFVVGSILFSLVVLSFTKSYRLPEKWGNLDQIGGLILGVLGGIFGILVISFVIRNTISLAWTASGRPTNYLYAIVQGFQDSLLMGVFRTMKFVFINILSPWLPRDLPVFTEL